MLELRPSCECCDKDLPPDAAEAMICTYECTFCRDCVENRLLGQQGYALRTSFLSLVNDAYRANLQKSDCRPRWACEGGLRRERRTEPRFARERSVIGNDRDLPVSRERI